MKLKYYSGAQVFDIIKELPDKEFLAMLNAFAKEPSADVVEVVRCRDCKFYNEAERMCNDTNGFDRWWKPNDFCSYGERRDDG